ncbi:MAG: hypothetical protein WAS05_00080 [Candidatus Nanopelagicales bacterium]
MASLKQVQEIVDEGLEKFEEYPLEVRQKNLPDRTFEVLILDYDKAYRGEVTDGEIVSLTFGAPGPRTDVRMVLTSDDLVALHSGELKFATAWASGRVRIDASIRDLLSLRTLAK